MSEHDPVIVQFQLLSNHNPKFNIKSHMVAEHGCSITKTLLNLFLIIVVTMSASANSTVDTKLLGKPKAYTNRREDWPGFKFVLLSYVGAVSSAIRTKMDAAERSVTTMPLNTMGNDSQQESSTVVFILSQVLTGSSLQLLMNTESGNGFEAWRLLCRREEPQSGTARVAQLTGLLRTQFWRLEGLRGGA